MVVIINKKGGCHFYTGDTQIKKGLKGQVGAEAPGRPRSYHFVVNVIIDKRKLS